MKKPSSKLIYTIGHSTHSIETFIEMVKSFDVELVADIRRFPSSRKFPNFNKENLSLSLAAAGIGYRHLESLGGRRPPRRDSINQVWRNASFRGYADYMETAEFKEGADELEKIALERTSAIMCAEAVWWRCHRSMVADYLKAKGWNVMHIMAKGKAEEHPFTSPARIADGHVYYSQANMFDDDKERE